MKERVIGALSGTRDELVQRRERDPDLQPDAPVPELAGLHERVHRCAADLEPGCYFRGADPVLDAPSEPATGAPNGGQ